MDALLDNSVIAIIFNAIVTILAVFGVGLGIVKKVTAALKESGDVLQVLHTAIADDKLTEEEVDAIVKEIDEAGGALLPALRTGRRPSGSQKRPPGHCPGLGRSDAGGNRGGHELGRRNAESGNPMEQDEDRRSGRYAALIPRT